MAKKSGQNVPSECHLDQFSWEEWAIIGDLFFSAVICLGLGLVILGFLRGLKKIRILALNYGKIRGFLGYFRVPKKK